MTRTGRCQCGAISYEVTGKPAHSAACWCDDCRASAGATPVVWALFPNAALTISGTPVSYASSPGTARQFCGTCGTGLFFINEAVFPNQTDIQAGTFDDKDAFPPQAHIQVADAPAWQGTHGDLRKFDRFPG
ncbi:MAG: GFA family protein [Pseudomonadota bacterium]